MSGEKKRFEVIGTLDDVDWKRVDEKPTGGAVRIEFGFTLSDRVGDEISGQLMDLAYPEGPVKKFKIVLEEV